VADPDIGLGASHHVGDPDILQGDQFNVSQ